MRVAAVAALLLAAVIASPAEAGPSELPLAKVASLLKAAQIDSAWSITQFSFPNNPHSLVIAAYSGKTQLAAELCRTQSTELELEVWGNDIKVLSTRAEKFYAFLPCNSAMSADQFLSVTGEFDPARLTKDVDAAVRYVADGKHDALTRVSFRDEFLRQYVGKLFVQDVVEVTVAKDGTATVVFLSPMLHLQELGVTVEHVVGGIHLVVETVADIDVVPVQQ